MKTFKIGDTVKYIGVIYYKNHPPRDSIGTVIERSPTNYYRIAFNGYSNSYWIHYDNLILIESKTNNVFKTGDRIKIIRPGDAYFNRYATITHIDDDGVPYCCAIDKDNNDIVHEAWYRADDIQLANKPKEECFTIFIRKHKRINLNFKL